MQILFCSAENFFSPLALQLEEWALRSDFATSGDVDDDVDHIAADTFVSGSRCFFGQRSLPRTMATWVVSPKGQVMEGGCSFSRSANALRRCRLMIAAAPAAATMISLASPANAQVIPSSSEEVAPPWNAQRIFEPSALPNLTDPDSREEVT